MKNAIDVTVRLMQQDDLPALLRLRARRLGTANEILFDGDIRSANLELCEALFERPARAWIWLASRDGGEAVGYACATAGFSVLERAYYLRIEELFVCDEAQGNTELIMVKKIFDAANEMGCTNLQWHFPAQSAVGARIAMHTGARKIDASHYVMPGMDHWDIWSPSPVIHHYQE